MSEFNSTVSYLVDILFTSPKAHLMKRREELLAQVIGLNANVFSYKGAYYRISSGEEVVVPVTNRVSIPFLPAPYILDFQTSLNEEATLKKDKKAITQVLLNLINECKNEQDLRDALPEILVPEASKAAYARTRPHGYTLENNPTQKRQYDKYYRKICLYSSYKLLY